MIGAYIRLYLKEVKGCKRYLMAFLIFYLMIVGISMFTMYLAKFNILLVDYIYNFAKISSILIFASGISLFLFFRCLKIKNSKVINLFASASFGVYLFHEHIFMKDFLWKNIFSVDKLLNGGFLLFKGLLIAVVIYLIGTVFEFVRKGIFKYFYDVFKSLRKN